MKRDPKIEDCYKCEGVDRECPRYCVILGQRCYHKQRIQTIFDDKGLIKKVVNKAWENGKSI